MRSPTPYSASMILKITLFCSLIATIFADPVTISGTINNPAGNPVKKAVVTLRNLKDNILMEEKTNRKGNFSFIDVEPNFYFLVIEHEGDGLNAAMRVSREATDKILRVIRGQLIKKQKRVS